MTMARKPTTSVDRSSDAAPAAGSVATPDSSFGATKADYSQFLWDKLNAIDGRMGELAENYGRIDARLDNMKGSIDKIDGKVSKLETQVRWAAAVITATVFVVGLIVAVYKLIDHHLTIGWH